MAADFKEILGNDIQQVKGKGRILYLEGKTDPEYFFALLGVPRPPDDIYQDVLVRGLSSNKGSGAAAVQELLKCAAADSRLMERVYGIRDGDGVPAPLHHSAFIASGPLLIWPCYCIENLFYGTGWPSTWGPEPVWATDLQPYAPYVAINRLQRQAHEVLARLGIDHFINPVKEQPLKTTESIQMEMRQHEHLLSRLHQVPEQFESYANEFLAALGSSVDDAQVFFNGKWLFKDFVPRRTGRSPKDSLTDWIAHAVRSGGHPQVRQLWRRLTGREPS